VFLAPFSSDEWAHEGSALAPSARFRLAGVDSKPGVGRSRPRAPSQFNARSLRAGAPGQRLVVGGPFAESTPLPRPYSSLYQPHQRLRTEFGK
jgi:hypothetical protein